MYLTLLELRNTPISNDIPSPAQLLFGRRLKGHIPVEESLLKPLEVNQNIVDSFRRNQTKQKMYYDKSAKELPDLKLNDSVMVQVDSKLWEPGVIVKIDDHRPRSYHVKLKANDKIFVRNRSFLRRIGSNMTEFSIKYWTKTYWLTLKTTCRRQTTLLKIISE